jgi:hypothetical protein
MKKYGFFSMLLSTLILILITISNGLVVDYQRNSGPELIVLIGVNNLLKDGEKFGVNNSGYAYSTYEFDNCCGFENIGISFANYKVIDSKPVGDGNKNERAALIEVKRFYSIYLVFGLILLNTTALILVIKRILKNKK